MKPDRESASLLAEAFADAPDFATEHRDLTVGDGERGGPEGVPENESPKGYGGADIRRSRRPKTQHKPVVRALGEPHPAAATPAVPQAVADPVPATLPDPIPEALSQPVPDTLAEPFPEELPETEPDFAVEHRHLTVGGSERYRTRRD